MRAFPTQKKSGLAGIIALLAGLAMIPSMALAASSEGTKGNPRMLNAPSPYLRIHANDLVQWYQWNEATFALARKLNRPLMVSFGYSACHWCHVMQETHFTVPDIAKTINDNFIPVIVDRERRPVLDETYMLATEVISNRGGWPNTVFMTADGKPFYGAAYVPADNFRKIMSVVIDSWEKENDKVLAEADRLSALLKKFLSRKAEGRELSSALLKNSATKLAENFDEFVGGYGGAPKFFQQSILMFLLQQAEREGNDKALAAVKLTLNSIISGGIHDQLEGGLHRYTVDPAWRIPHFEKMLYDQAMMVEAFAEAYRITGQPAYADMTRKIIDYVLADLSDPAGGFYATRDADSEGREGTYYVWTRAQLEKVLGKKDAAFAIETFELVAEGELAGKVILNRDQIKGETPPRIEAILEKLAQARAKRIKPRRDEKIVASWNGMMIAAMARAAIILDDQSYHEAALKAANFLWDNLRRKDGTMLRIYFRGKAGIDAELVDYAWLGRAFVELYDTGGDDVWLQRAKTLFGEMDTLFSDSENGDYYSSQKETSFGRPKSRQDSDKSSGNGVALDFLVALTKRAKSPAMERRTEQLLAALSGFAAENAAGGASILTAAYEHANGETGPVQFGGGGTVRVAARAENDQLVLDIQIAKGWHINAEKPLEDYLVPTKMTAGAGVDVVYPEPVVKSLGFSKKPLALIEGNVQIRGLLDDDAIGGGKIDLEIQACSDKICLAPDTLKFTVSPPEPSG